MSPVPDAAVRASYETGEAEGPDQALPDGLSCFLNERPLLGMLREVWYGNQERAAAAAAAAANTAAPAAVPAANGRSSPSKQVP